MAPVKKFCVAEVIRDGQDCFHVLPSTWITKEEGQLVTYWPGNDLYHDESGLLELVKDQMDHKSKWQTIIVKSVLHKFDEFEKAFLKLEKLRPKLSTVRPRSERTSTKNLTSKAPVIAPIIRKNRKSHSEPQIAQPSESDLDLFGGEVSKKKELPVKQSKDEKKAQMDKALVPSSTEKPKSKPDNTTSDLSSGSDEEEEGRKKEPPRKQLTNASPKKRKAEEVEVASNKKMKSKPDKKTSDVSSGTDEEEDNKEDPPGKQSISKSVDNKGKKGGRRGKSAAGNSSSSSEEEDASDGDLPVKKRQDTTPEMKKISSASSILEDERKEESEAELLLPPTDDEEGEDDRDSRKKASSSDQSSNGEIKLKKLDSNNKVRISKPKNVKKIICSRETMYRAILNVKFELKMVKLQQSEIKTYQREILSKLNKIINGKRKTVSTAEGEAQEDVPSLPMFPIHSPDEFDELERCIQVYPSLKENMIEECSYFGGGKDLKKMAQASLENLLSRELAALFTNTGTSTKKLQEGEEKPKKFVGTGTHHVAVAGIRRKQQREGVKLMDFNEADVHFGRWFTLSKRMVDGAAGKANPADDAT